MNSNTIKQIAIIFVFLFSVWKQTVYAQNSPDSLSLNRPLNNIGVNLLGDGAVLGLNYDRLIPVNRHLFWSFLCGIGYNEEFPLGASSERYWTIPHHVTINWGGGINFFEAGFGGTIIIGETTQPYFFYPTIGYRLHPLKKGKSFIRLYCSVPVTGIGGDDILFIPVGVSFGCSF